MHVCVALWSWEWEEWISDFTGIWVGLVLTGGECVEVSQHASFSRQSSFVGFAFCVNSTTALCWREKLLPYVSLVVVLVQVYTCQLCTLCYLQLTFFRTDKPSTEPWHSQYYWPNFSKCSKLVYSLLSEEKLVRYSLSFFPLSCVLNLT